MPNSSAMPPSSPTSKALFLSVPRLREPTNSLESIVLCFKTNILYKTVPYWAGLGPRGVVRFPYFAFFRRTTPEKGSGSLTLASSSHKNSSSQHKPRSLPTNQQERLAPRNEHYLATKPHITIATMAISKKVTTSRLSAKAKATMKKPKVSFSQVQVRMYPITLGDNPGGFEGPPLQLSWDYFTLGESSVEAFERHRVRPKYQRRSMHALWITPQRRFGLLLQAGFSKNEIVDSMNSVTEERTARSTFQRVLLKSKIRKADLLLAEGAAALKLAEVRA